MGCLQKIFISHVNGVNDLIILDKKDIKCQDTIYNLKLKSPGAGIAFNLSKNLQ